MKNMMGFSIDEIAPLHPGGNIFTATLIPEINTKYFAPLQLRSVNIKAELLEESFYNAIMSGETYVSDGRLRPQKFLGSVVQGAYYEVNKYLMPKDAFNSEMIIGPENDFFKEGLQETSPFLVIENEKDPLNINKALPQLSNDDLGRGDALYVYGLYVGQGDSILMVCPNGSTYLIDTNYYWINNPSIYYQINRILRLHGLPPNRIKAMIITHKHLDHIRGAWDFIDRFDVEYFLINYNYDHPTRPVQLLLETVNKRIPNLVNVNEPAVIQEGRVSINIKNPDHGTRDKTNAPNINDSSIALDVEHMGRHAFLTGDAGYPIIYSRFGWNCRSGNILKVSHHGSRTGTNEELVDNLSPQCSFISAGNHKRFHHPHDEVKELLYKRSKLTISKDIRCTVCYRISSDGTDEYLEVPYIRAVAGSSWY